MSFNPVALILGAGPRVGASVAEAFANKGYKVAVASRSGSDTKNENGYLSLKVDFSKPETVPALFDAVKAEFHNTPSVVVYNAASFTAPPKADSLFSISAMSVGADLMINTISPYVAAQHALSEWESLPKETKKTFIYTGNAMNTTLIPVPMMMNLGLGKSASAYWIGVADNAYSPRGIRFFYADERQDDGKVKGMALDGPAHGEFYAQLAEHVENVPWNATFVKGKGYVRF